MQLWSLFRYHLLFPLALFFRTIFGGKHLPYVSFTSEPDLSPQTVTSNFLKSEPSMFLALVIIFPPFLLSATLRHDAVQFTALSKAFSGHPNLIRTMNLEWDTTTAHPIVSPSPSSSSRSHSCAASKHVPPDDLCLESLGCCGTVALSAAHILNFMELMITDPIALSPGTCLMSCLSPKHVSVSSILNHGQQVLSSAH